jgi:hypothetical protein
LARFLFALFSSRTAGAVAACALLKLGSGVQRIVLNGSFVTDIMEPNDVDCVLLVGPGFPADPIAEAELTAGLPFLEI